MAEKEFEVIDKRIELAHVLDSTIDAKNDILKKKEEAGNQLKVSSPNVLDALEESPMDIVTKKLAKVTKEELVRDYLPYPDKVKWFFFDEETQSTVGFIKEGTLSKDEEYKYQKDVLMFFKETDEALEQLDQIYKESNEELKKIIDDLGDINKIYNINLLEYVRNFEKEADEKGIKNIGSLQTIEGIYSAYDFRCIFEMLEEHPTVIKNTLDDYRNSARIKNLGERYSIRLKQGKIKISLTSFLSFKDQHPVEKLTIPNDYLEGTEDLFIFILIRFFALEGLSNTMTRKFHVSVWLVIHNLLTGSLSDEETKMFLSNMKRLLKMYYDQMPTAKEIAPLNGGDTI